MSTKQEKREKIAKQIAEEIPEMVEFLKEQEGEGGEAPTLIEAFINAAIDESRRVSPMVMMVAPHTLFIMGFSSALRLAERDVDTARAYRAAIDEFAETTEDDFGRPDYLAELFVAVRFALDAYAVSKGEAPTE